MSRPIPESILEARGWTVDAVARLELGYDGSRVVFPVRGSAGEPLGELRYLPNAGNGARKMLAAAGGTRELFPPPEDVADDEHRGELWLVEGEPDCVRAWSAGVAAVAVPGVQGWDSAWAARFRGPDWRVLVCFDADDEGRKAAATIVRDLVELGVDARLVDLERHAHGASGFDLTDLLAGREPLVARAILDALTDSATFVEAPSAPPATSSDSFRLRAYTARELYALPDPPTSDLLCGPLVVRGNRTIIVADTGHGKTTLAGQLAAAVLTGDEAFEHVGAGVGPIMFVDLEQGRRSIKRLLRETALHERGDVIYVPIPDGLALDVDDEHRAELERLLVEHRPAVLVLDPLYKAHRGDANEERAIVPLMRYLDALRVEHGFALLLPVHPRKDPLSKNARKLTLHDVAGSGAITRGAELVLGLERLAHGYARLRILKDRDGDLEVGAAWPLLFERGEGFRLDPREQQADDELEQRILASEPAASTVKEWATELGIREARAKAILERLVEAGELEVAVGPPGRAANARCYSTTPAPWEQPGAAPQQLFEAGAAPAAPDPVRGRSSRTGAAGGRGDDSGAAADPDELERLAELALEAQREAES